MKAEASQQRLERQQLAARMADAERAWQQERERLSTQLASDASLAAQNVAAVQKKKRKKKEKEKRKEKKKRKKKKENSPLEAMMVLGGAVINHLTLLPFLPPCSHGRCAPS
jgi:hypothetical protein